MPRTHGLRIYEETDRNKASERSQSANETWKKIFVVSNRLPFKVVQDAGGNPVLEPSAGGLVTAMGPLLHKGITGVWFGWPGAVDDENLEEALRSKWDGQFDIGIVSLSEEEVVEYYEGYSNQVLSPLLVSEVEKIDISIAHSCWNTYQSVPVKFAEKICESLDSDTIVWVQDFHLISLGKALRDRGATAPIGFFLHTPFPSEKVFAVLPLIQRHVLLRHMLAYDILGFQTKTFAHNFIEAVRTQIPQTKIRWRSDESIQIIYHGHITEIGSHPISIDCNEFEQQLFAIDTQHNVRRLTRALKKMGGVQLIFNAGRQDYSKGFLEELVAFDRLLENHPELVGKVLLCQLVIPSRGKIQAYREYREKIIALAKYLNQKYGQRVVRQLHTHMGRARYLAHLNVADIQSVPTKWDGMNLIAKESAVVGHPMTVLVLGENAGAVEELGEYALLINPSDTEHFANTLFDALHMRMREKRRRKSGLKGKVFANDIFNWWTCKQEPMFQKIWDKKRLAQE